ncbi:NAD(P)-dependent oxidoreductase [Microbacterium sp. BWR-S6Y]|uniref:NAD-dependent epimerase/dehydratase family protein n=1 Tax=Microbacterium sp. BWR-S6Y TaxID=3232073 RepID=UPI00352853F9
MISHLEGSRIVVTGAAGLIGRATVAHLVAAGARVVGFDVVGAVSMEGVEWVTGDVTDEGALRFAFTDADAVVHLGGIAGMDVTDDITTYRVNTVGTYAAFSVAASLDVAKVVYASSINASGLPLGRLRAPSRLPYDETETPAFGDSYSLSKDANEQAARMAHATWGLHLTGLRFPLVRDVTLDGGRRFAKHVRDALDEQAVRQAYEGWSYLDVSDAARAIEAALLRDTPPAPGILVAAPLTYLSEDTASAAAAVVPDVPVAGLVGRAVGLDLSRARELLGFEARVAFEDAGPDLLQSVAR